MGFASCYFERAPSFLDTDLWFFSGTCSDLVTSGRSRMRHRNLLKVTIPDIVILFHITFHIIPLRRFV